MKITTSIDLPPGSLFRDSNGDLWVALINGNVMQVVNDPSTRTWESSRWQKFNDEYSPFTIFPQKESEA